MPIINVQKFKPFFLFTFTNINYSHSIFFYVLYIDHTYLTHIYFEYPGKTRKNTKSLCFLFLSSQKTYIMQYHVQLKFLIKISRIAIQRKIFNKKIIFIHNFRTKECSKKKGEEQKGKS